MNAQECMTHEVEALDYIAGGPFLQYKPVPIYYHPSPKLLSALLHCRAALPRIAAAWKLRIARYMQSDATYQWTKAAKLTHAPKEHINNNEYLETSATNVHIKEPDTYAY